MKQRAPDLLTTLLSSVSRDTFFREYWEKQPYIQHGDMSQIGECLNVPCLKNVESLLAAYPSPVMVIGKVALRESEGLSDRILVTPTQALKFYREGATLELDCADMYIDEIRRFVSSLSSSLELPKGTFPKAIVYVSSNGSGVSPHFDAYANMVFQLTGRKTWFLLDNTNAPCPAEHYDLGEYPYMPEELKLYWTGTAPEKYKEVAEPVTLAPGSIMYVPRGHWHSTNTLEESISVHVTYSIPSWFDLAIAELRSKLVKSLLWRGLVSASNEMRAVQYQMAADFIQELQQSLVTFTPEELLSRMDEPHDKYQLANAVFRQVLRLPFEQLVEPPESEKMAIGIVKT